jgi:hypothetical protein
VCGGSGAHQRPPNRCRVLLLLLLLWSDARACSRGEGRGAASAPRLGPRPSPAAAGLHALDLVVDLGVQVAQAVEVLTGQGLLAANRSLSQLVASFIASWHQGIHLLHLVA